MKYIMGHASKLPQDSEIIQKLDEMTASMDNLEKQLKKLYDPVIAQRMEDDGK